jgi:dihydroorotate dehydrogenase electron transfer subunit
MHIEIARIIGHDPAPGGYRRLLLSAPRMAAEACPGQFVHLRIPNIGAESLRRPFSICMTAGDTLTLLYKNVGRGTEAMTHLAIGADLNLLGPLGNGFPTALDGRIPLLVGGGYGVAPLLFLASRLERAGVLFIGGRSAEDILLEKEFESLGWTVCVATEDGSQGTRGLVTVSIDEWLAAHPEERTIWFSCGPNGLLRAVGERAAKLSAPAWVSMDKEMGCGVGACLACVNKVRAPDGTVEIVRVCRDGPVFAADQVQWEDL